MSNKNKFKIVIGILLIIAAVILLQYKKTKSQEIVLGVLIPETGSGADQGEWNKQGLELALKELQNAGSLAKKIRLEYQDTQGDTKIAISAYNNLKSRFNMPVIFTWGSGVGIALEPIVNSDKVIQMGIATGSPKYSTPNDFNFRNYASATQEGEFLANELYDNQKIKEVAVIKINNDYGVAEAQTFMENYQRKGGRILSNETFEPKATDFRTQLTKIRLTNPKYIFIATYPTEGAILLNQAKGLGIKAKFIASTAILGNSFFKIAGNSIQGLMVINSTPGLSNTNDPAVQKFTKEYQEMFHQNLGAGQLYTARAYDALKIVASAINNCGNETECIKNNLSMTKNYHGISGNISFDSNGDVTSDFNLQIVKDGKFINLPLSMP